MALTSPFLFIKIGEFADRGNNGQMTRVAKII